MPCQGGSVPACNLRQRRRKPEQGGPSGAGGRVDIGVGGDEWPVTDHDLCRPMRSRKASALARTRRRRQLLGRVASGPPQDQSPQQNRDGQSRRSNFGSQDTFGIRVKQCVR